MLPQNNQNNNKRDGQALLLVIAILAMLFIITLAFFVLSQVERTSAFRHLNSLRAQYIAEAGIAYGRKILEKDKQSNLIDSLGDLTFTNFLGQDADLDGDGKNESRTFTLTDIQGNPFGRFSLKISDESSRLHLNHAYKEILERLFSSIGIGSSKLNTILSGRPFNAKEELGSILGTKDFSLGKDYLTVYSRDFEVDLDGNRRAYLNSSQPRVILEALLAAGVSNPYQKAANLKDASDVDLSQTLLDEFSLNFPPTDLLEQGAWRKKNGFYEALPQDENPGRFIWSNLAIQDGEYLCFLYGPQGTDVVSGEPLLFSGEKWPEPVKVEGGDLSLLVKPAKGKTSRFSYIKLASIDSKNGLNRRVISGTEALVINEIMVRPSKEILAQAPAYIESGQSKNWSFDQLKPGYYYVVVEALQQGGLIGDVYINGRVSKKLRDQDYFPETINVGQDGKITLQIENKSLERASFKGIKVLQEPDGEFIEIVNLSPNEINLDDCSVEVYTNLGDAVAGWPGRIPQDIKIQPYQHLVLAVDSNDTLPSPQKLRANQIYFSDIYKSNAISLIFDGSNTIKDNFDLLPNSGARVILKDSSGNRIDAVEYNSLQIQDFVSLERGDPSANIDGDGNGFFDGWYLSAGNDFTTAGIANENSGMYTLDEISGNLIKNNVSQIKVFNQAISNLEEVQQLSLGEGWKNFTLSDIAQMADHFAYESIDLEMKNYEKGFEADNIGIWEFPQLAPGNYLLNILDTDINLGGSQIQVGIKTDPQEVFKDFKTLLFNQGAAFYGRVEIPAASSILQLKIIADSKKTISSLSKIRLEPIFSTAGRVNINTANLEILRSLFDSQTLAETAIKSRPIGTNNARKLGVGELFLLDTGFLPFVNYLTVKSDVYEIYSRGDFSVQDKLISYQTIRSVIERGN